MLLLLWNKFLMTFYISYWFFFVYVGSHSATQINGLFAETESIKGQEEQAYTGRG